ncbi:hypothetical protein BC835DRAFT_1079022 [Cytidiella melzeri]|nr:hypothetical protein BC835DRAFT_1079022 [Cytidiella melzeri]
MTAHTTTCLGSCIDMNLSLLHSFRFLVARVHPVGAHFHPPRQTLSSYASAESLYKRTIKRASPKQQASTPGRSGSPSQIHRARPRSPLAEHSDFDEDDQVAWQSMLTESPPANTTSHPSRQSSFESNSSHISRTSGAQPAARVPMSMTMTSMASHERRGVVEDRKGKGKMHQKDKKPSASPVHAPRQTTRKRSSTVQSPSTQSPQSAYPWSSDVAAMSTLTASSGRLPSSDTSVSDFESPKFAHPEESE